MDTYADKVQQSKGPVETVASAELHSAGEVSVQVGNNRPEAVAQRQLQRAIDASPRVQQAAAVQRAIAGSLQARQAQAHPAAPTLWPAAPVQKKANTTGLPDALKAGVENLSGHSLDDVQVHYNSDEPGQLQAHAYAQGTDIHLAPGQEKHLPHEAWHVAQQKQGRVKPTMQLKGRVNVNDDAGLEKEADVMGAKASRLGAGPIQSKKEEQPPAAGVAPAGTGARSQVLQGNFPDAYNSDRRTEQGIAAADVQLDHMVPQAGLKKFADTFVTLTKLTSAPGTKWEHTKAAMVLLRAAANKSSAPGHTLMSDSHLVNLPNNIVPGRADQVQGAGDDFDPQVAKKSTSGNSDRYEETAASTSQRTMDAAMTKLTNSISADVLPAVAAESKKGGRYDEETDRWIAAEIIVLAGAFDKLSQMTEPTYDAGVWYEHGEEGKQVKKRPADWIKDESQVAIGGTEAPAQDSWEHEFTFASHALGATDAGGVKLIPVTIAVNVEIPAATWTHIYERHYLPTFAGTVEAVNTFWKTDPFDYLTAGGTAVLESELKLILNKTFNFLKPYNNLGEPPESEDGSWSQPAQKLFFQGNAISMLEEKSPAAIAYLVTVELKSIAPQNADLAYALLPSQLPGYDAE